MEPIFAHDANRLTNHDPFASTKANSSAPQVAAVGPVAAIGAVHVHAMSSSPYDPLVFAHGMRDTGHAWRRWVTVHGVVKTVPVAIKELNWQGLHFTLEGDRETFEVITGLLQDDHGSLEALAVGDELTLHGYRIQPDSSRRLIAIRIERRILPQPQAPFRGAIALQGHVAPESSMLGQNPLSHPTVGPASVAVEGLDGLMHRIDEGNGSTDQEPNTPDLLDLQTSLGLPPVHLGPL